MAEHAPVGAIHQAVDDIEALDVVGVDRVELWYDVEEARDAVAVVVRQLGIDAVDIVADLQAAAGRKLRDDLQLPSGRVVNVARGHVRETWRGHDLLGALAVEVVDRETGAIVRAVPLEVLRAAVPGCTTPDLTSSKWRTTGLRDLVDVDRYRERGDAPDVLRRGVGWRP